jgi:predicted ATPase
MCIVVNLFGGPGTGKSTTAAELFAVMKKQGKNVELVTEYAKDLTYEGRRNILESDQLYIFAKQHRRMKRLHGQVDYIVTDSPLFLSVVYARYFSDQDHGSFIDLVIDTHNKYDNLNIFIERDLEEHSYKEHGRSQTEDEAITLDDAISHHLSIFSIGYETIKFDNKTMVNQILKLIEKKEE